MFSPNISQCEPNSYEYYVETSNSPFLMTKKEFEDKKLHENDILVRINDFFISVFEAMTPKKYHALPFHVKFTVVALVAKLEYYSDTTMKMTKNACVAVWIFLITGTQKNKEGVK